MAEDVVQGGENPTVDGPALDATRSGVLLLSVMVVALCGITYELIAATVSSYLLGNSVYQFSITIGLFMFAMGAGSHFTRHITTRLVERFVVVEMAVALVGGLSSTILFLVFPYVAFYKPVMYALVFVVGMLVGLEIPLLTRILSASAGLRQAIANVLSLDYFGALVGAVGFPILLLPMLGLFRASFVIGLLNISVAALTVAVFRRQLRGLWAYVAMCVLIGATLAVALALTARITQYAEGQLFADQIQFRQQTPYQRIIVTRNETNQEIRLYLDGHIQFAAGDEYRYHEALVDPVMSLPGPRRRVLILGGGDGLAARDVLRYEGVERIDLVDIDPAMTELCRRFEPIRKLNQGSLDDPRVTLHHQDAFNFVLHATERFDRVIIDLPDPHNEVLSKLYSVEFYKGLRRILADGGYFVTQSSSPYRTREAYWSVAATIRAAEIDDLGPMDVLSYNVALPSFGLWGFHLAAREGPAPEQFALDSSRSRYMTAEVFAASRVFSKDTGPLDMPVNSLFEPSLYLRYQRGVMQ